MIHKQNIKLDISKRLINNISKWKELSTEHVDFIPGTEMGIVFAYGLPIIRISKENKGSVNAINVKLLNRCAKSRFLARERFEVPILKTKGGLFLEVDYPLVPSFRRSSKPKDNDEDSEPRLSILLPQTTVWTVVQGLCPNFFYAKMLDSKVVVIPQQLSLFKDVWTKEGIKFSAYAEGYTGIDYSVDVRNASIAPNLDAIERAWFDQGRVYAELVNGTLTTASPDIRDEFFRNRTTASIASTASTTSTFVDTESIRTYRIPPFNFRSVYNPDTSV